MRLGSNEATSAPKNCALKMKTNRGGKKILRKISTSANTAVAMASVLANARGRIVIMKPYLMLGECRVKCNVAEGLSRGWTWKTATLTLRLNYSCCLGSIEHGRVPVD